MTLSSEAAESVESLTAGDVSRLLEVDLTTVHRWVQLGYMRARRTAGRHLRFHRTEVVRFLRRTGCAVPDQLGEVPPRVLAMGYRHKDARLAALSRSCRVDFYDSLFGGVIAASSTSYEVVAIHLDQFALVQVLDLVASLRSWPSTTGLMILGVSTRQRHRQLFVRRGADAAMREVSTLEPTIQWLAGCGERPARVECTMAEDPSVRLRLSAH
jgi:excisionase family DNA binding protein